MTDLHSSGPDDGDMADADRRFDEVISTACARLRLNQPVRRNLPGNGRLRIDRQLPFLCIYRSPPTGPDPGTRELVTTEAAYLFASGEPRFHARLGALCQQINEVMREHFGTFLFLEIWADDKVGTLRNSPAPTFEIVSPDRDSLPATMETFTEALSQVRIDGLAARVKTRPSEVAPPDLLPLVHARANSGGTGCCVVGIGVRPVYRDPQSGALFPLVLQELRWQLAYALRKAIAQFAGLELPGAAAGVYHALGPSSLVKAARIVDQQLCEVSESFDFLLQVTPTNSEAAWEQFRESKFREVPVFQYRPLPYRPSLLKRRLFNIEVERIEDPTLAHMFWEKQDELGRQLTALQDLGTPQFLHSSHQLFGEASNSLVQLAADILKKFPSQPETSEQNRLVSTGEVVERARDEIDYYHQRLNTFKATVEVCDHIASGIMVSHDRLLVSESLRVRPERIEPLLHHEIGTHLLTYFNGLCQPLRQLYAGLAGYDELQEGLAVLAEYLSGGLTAKRLRSLAGRVAAVHCMTSGETFVDTFHVLHDQHQFPARQAFFTTLRAYRGGGFTKDVIYLRGLRGLLKYLEAGHDVEPLYVGKIGLHHLPYVQEMRRRGIINAPSVLPRFWDNDNIRDRLAACRGLSVPQLLETGP